MKFDSVGSFLPPETLIQARESLSKGHISSAEFKSIEDAAVSDIIRRQLACGLPAITSGELRRQYWDKDFYFSLCGIVREKVETGRIYQETETFTDLLKFTDRISYNPEHPFFADFNFLVEAVAGRAVCRQTLPSPANLYLDILSSADGNLARIYPSPETLIDDIARAYRLTILHFYDLGCRSIQYDGTVVGSLCDDSYAKELLQGGIDIIKFQDDVITLINKSLADLPADLETSFYLSAGTQIIPRYDQRDLPDNICPKALSRLNVHRFFMPFDAHDEESLEVLRLVPAHKQISIGLIGAHSPFSEGADAIRSAIRYALGFIAPERLSICPHSGFKLSTYESRGLNFEDQWTKLSDLAGLAAEF